MSDQNLAPPRGMRDFYPAEFSEREALFTIWKDQARSFGFEFYDAPVVETLQLLTRKAGEEIVDQIYSFQDKSGRELALRPEMTPSLVRMVLAKKGKLRFPLKWSSIPQCFRYERMSTGRRREHYQWNIDILGEAGLSADAEIVTMGVRALQDLGFTSQEVTVLFGSKKVMAELLKFYNLPEDKYQTVFLAVDKKGKITESELRELLSDQGLSKADVDCVFKILNISTIDDVERLLGSESAGVKDVREFLRYVSTYGIGEYVKFDLGIVRGLSYYTGIVFEAFDRERKFRSIFGGGRYDNLFSQLGGVDLPAVGLGFGDLVVRDVLEHYNHSVNTKANETYFVIYSEPSLEADAIRTANRLRAGGKNVLACLKPLRMRNGLRLANERGLDYAIILDPREVQNGSFIIKNLRTGEQHLESISK